MTSKLAIIITKDLQLSVAFDFGIVSSSQEMDDFRFVVEAACLRARGLEMRKVKCHLDVMTTKTPQHLHGLPIECYRAFACLRNLMILLNCLIHAMLIPFYQLIYLNQRAAQLCTHCNIFCCSRTWSPLWSMSFTIYHSLG